LPCEHGALSSRQGPPAGTGAGPEPGCHLQSSGLRRGPQRRQPGAPRWARVLGACGPPLAPCGQYHLLVSTGRSHHAIRAGAIAGSSRGLHALHPPAPVKLCCGCAARHTFAATALFSGSWVATLCTVPPWATAKTNHFFLEQTILGMKLKPELPPVSAPSGRHQGAPAPARLLSTVVTLATAAVSAWRKGAPTFPNSQLHCWETLLPGASRKHFSSANCEAACCMPVPVLT